MWTLSSWRYDGGERRSVKLTCFFRQLWDMFHHQSVLDRLNEDDSSKVRLSPCDMAPETVSACRRTHEPCSDNLGKK